MDNRSVSKGITQNYFTFSGRLNRKPFILRSIVATFVPILLAILLFLLFAGGFRPGMEYQHKNLLWLHVLLHSLLIILAIVAGFSLGIRRCHDLDKSGWWLLLGMIPYINVAWDNRRQHERYPETIIPIKAKPSAFRSRVFFMPERH